MATLGDDHEKASAHSLERDSGAAAFHGESDMSGQDTFKRLERVFHAGSAHNDVKRGMKSRHLTMIALGGTIGTGIFLSAGSSIALAGPGATLLSYFIVGLFVYAVVISLGEMAAMYPVSGAFSVFGARFVSPALGFTLGWNYWFQWTLSIPSELTAASVILHYWTDALLPWHWALIIVVPMFGLQLIHVRVYGEMEYWFALIKVLLIILFIVVGLIYDWGGVIGHPGPGLANFHDGQSFTSFGTFAKTFLYAFFSFGGAELVALAAGESDQPHKSVPRAVRATFARIVLFYILAILVMGLCINRDDPTLLSAAYDSNVAASPITVVFVRAGFGAAAHVVNAVLLTAVLSATNACFYASSRMLLSLAREGQAPAIFGIVNHRGVPVYALLLAFAASFISFLTSIWSAGVVFTWLLNLAGISALLVWISIGVISLRFRAAWRKQDRAVEDLPFIQPFFPLLPLGVLILGIAMFVAEGYAAVASDPFDPRNVVATYIGVALYVVLYGGYTIYHRICSDEPHFVPLHEVDLDTDAVWPSGHGVAVRKAEREEREKERKAGGWNAVRAWAKRWTA